MTCLIIIFGNGFGALFAVQQINCVHGHRVDLANALIVPLDTNVTAQMRCGQMAS